MRLTLSAHDVARCEAASQILLAPLAAATVEAWRAGAAHALRTLLHADVLVVGLPGETAEAVYADGADPRDVRACRAALASSHDGAGRLYALRVPTPAGEALLGAYYARADARSFGEAAALLLRALLPSFRSGLDVLTRFHAHRACLDALTEPVAVFGRGGRELHRNRAFTHLLDADDERALVVEGMKHVVLQLNPVALGRAGRAAEAPAAVPLRVVETRRGRYELRGTVLAPGAFGTEGGAMISVAASGLPLLPTPEALRARHGLTRREAEVALLLAEGLPNDALSDRLFISPHTARRHTENVLSKLGLNSRQALALKLME